MKKWLIRVAIFCGVVIALATIAGIAFWSMTGFAGSSSDAPKQFAEWKKNRLPVSASEVYLGGPVSDAENAALDVQTLRKDTGFKFPKPPDANYEDAWTSGEIATYLRTHQTQIGTIARVAEKPKFLLTKDYDSLISSDFPEFSEIKAWSKLLVMDAEQMAREGRHDQAVARLRSARNLARLTGQDSTLIGRLVAIAVEAIVLTAAGRVASEIADDPRSLQALRKMLDETEWSLDVKQIYRTEAYIGFSALRDISLRDIFSMNQSIDLPGGSAPSKESKPTGELPKNAAARAVTAETMRFWNEFYPRLDTETDMIKLGDDMSKRGDEFANSGSWPKKFASMFAPVFKQSAIAHERVKSERNTINAYISVLLYRNQHKKWPAILEDAGIKGDRKLDHITKAPLQYRKTATEMRIWHSGPDGVDDGGLTMREALAAGRSSKSRDSVYIHPWPKLWRTTSP